MTGYRSKYLRHRCPEKGCYLETLPEWDDLIECFPRRIRPTDIDGLVEINGNFLLLEEKTAGKGPDDGQRLALRKLSDRRGVTTVFFRPLVRPNGGPFDVFNDDLEVLVFDQNEPEGWQVRTRDWFKQWLRAWSEKADRNPFLEVA